MNSILCIPCQYIAYVINYYFVVVVVVPFPFIHRQIHIFVQFLFVYALCDVFAAGLRGKASDLDGKCLPNLVQL